MAPKVSFWRPLMRILLMHHLPLAQSEAGRLVRQWARALEEAGHEARLLIVDEQGQDRETLSIERVVCRAGDAAADLPFAAPGFSTPAGSPSPVTFDALTDRQLADYRELMRRRLDELVDRFDPHVIHVQHIWVQGQLSLETGVPYVLNAWEHELVEYERDARYRGLAEQAAENASWILVPDESVLRQIVDTFETAGERASVMPTELVACDSVDSRAARAEAAVRLVAIYQAVLDARFGKHP